MKKKKRILIAFGTRPEGLKFAPLIHALKKSSLFDCKVCLTGQHREMIDQVVRLFKIKIDADLALMKENQSLEEISGKVLFHFSNVLRSLRPDIVMVQGDTATALMCGIATYYARIPLVHLEAGLRSHEKYQPFPEEINRTALSDIADWHLATTPAAVKNLQTEGIRAPTIFQVGNTIVDTVLMMPRLVKKNYPAFHQIDPRKKIIFVTAHRRENFGTGLQGIFEALLEIANRHADVQIIYPVHLNPNVQHPASRILSNHPRVILLKPITYDETFWLMKRSHIILTDSGGIQEEAPTLRIPVLVLRNVTERVEGIQSGVARLVGTEKNKIIREFSRLMKSTRAYNQMAGRSKNPYGDGRASERIVKILQRILFNQKIDRKFRSLVTFR